MNFLEYLRIQQRGTIVRNQRTSYRAQEMEPGSRSNSSKRFTECTFPREMLINEGKFPRRFDKMWNLRVAFRLRKVSHGNSEEHRSIVIESNA